jgi:hypothetical protein
MAIRKLKTFICDTDPLIALMDRTKTMIILSIQ